MISDTEKELKEKRDEAEAVFKRWYSNAVELSSDLGTEPSVPRTASRQQHRANAPHDTPEEYYRRNLFVPFLDHITQEMSSRFGNTQKTAVQLLGLVPSITVSHTDANIDAVSEMYRSDLPNPQTLDVEYHRWTRKWQSERSQPDALQPALEVCDADIFPNIHCLLRIACTIPVTSADNERANSTLKLVKGYLRTTMTTERLSGLALMNIHHKKPVDYDAVVQKFVEQQPRRMLLADPIFEES
ncbi:52 kDa repressor of the inhibitor of the protein kinase-like [Porites lutea]